LCLILDCHNSIYRVYTREWSGWSEDNSMLVYYIQYIIQNFMRWFKNATLKKEFVNMDKYFFFKTKFNI